jgi:GNAT superfamily N-acetyltransferase
MIRPCTDDEQPTIEEIINEAASKYRGVIPADRWHEPYMSAEELAQERAAGVAFWGYYDGEILAGVMGLQRVRDATLIRHAYVRPAFQSRGIGALLLDHFINETSGELLVGTWAAATWAIRFYERHGFRLTATDEKNQLLDAYWTIPRRQRDTSVVLRLERC